MEKEYLSIQSFPILQSQHPLYNFSVAHDAALPAAPLHLEKSMRETAASALELDSLMYLWHPKSLERILHSGRGISKKKAIIAVDKNAGTMRPLCPLNDPLSRRVAC